MDNLLSRDEFKKQVFDRDNNKCVICGEPAIDAHHIIDRKLWKQSDEYNGYFLSNGASVCAEHHLLCETTEISVEDIRKACGITEYKIPACLEQNSLYDKWGNVLLANGQRMKGEMFFDDNVQKILKKGNMLGIFTDYVKYPRTFHCPWSLGLSNDDKKHQNMSVFENQRVIVTIKMDGESASLYNDYYHARSIDGRHHPSRDWIKQFHNSIKYDIPKGWRICGENLYAQHSISYDKLESYFYGFSIWNNKNIALSWDETIEYFMLLGIVSVPVIYDGIYDEDIIKKLWNSISLDHEGYVIRLASEIPYNKFNEYVAKFVRAQHVQTDTHWMSASVVKNILKTDL